MSVAPRSHGEDRALLSTVVVPCFDAHLVQPQPFTTEDTYWQLILARLETRHALRQLRAQRVQQMSRIYTVMVCLVSLIFVQFLLLTVALEGYLGRHVEVALPTALVSGLCCTAAYWLLRYIRVPG